MNTATNSFKPGLAGDTTQSAKNLAKTIAKQIAREPWEILKQGGRQIAGTEQVQRQEDLGQQGVDNSFNESQELHTERDRVRSQRLMQALQTELDEIKKKKEQEKLAQKQHEDMTQQENKDNPQPLIEVSSRPSRKFGNLFGRGKKSQVQRQQTQTERPLPPSG
jgi:hypothetical protein